MLSVLDGIRVVTLAPNIPGPVAAARLRDLGARVVKIEAPSGDLLEAAAPEWYALLHDGIETTTADLKVAAGREVLDGRLAEADVFLTSVRMEALARLGYAWEGLQVRFPRLIHVALVGEEPPDPERPGHDLTYLARAGLLDPHALPRSLFVDLAGAERAVSAVFAALYARERGGAPTQSVVSLARVALSLAEPRRAGLTRAGAVLGGGFAGYRVYESADGFVALAALEPHFFEELCDALLESGTFESLETAFASQPSAYWESFARQRDLPLAIVQSG